MTYDLGHDRIILTGHDFGHGGVALTSHGRSCPGMTGRCLIMAVHDYDDYTYIHVS